MTTWLSVMGRAWPLPRRRRPPVDPFRTLEVQSALSRLDHEIAELLYRDEPLFARAHHLHAAVAAYGQALDEACGLAGVALPSAGPALRRVLAEAELRTRGWEW